MDLEDFLYSADYSIEGLHYLQECQEPLSSASASGMSFEAITAILVGGGVLGYGVARKYRQELEEEHVENPPADDNSYSDL